MRKKTNKSINKEIILGFCTLFAVATILYLAFQITRPFLGIIATAGIFGIFINPLYIKLQSKTKKREIAAFITIIAFLFFLILPLAMLTASLTSQIIETTRSLQSNTELINSLQITLQTQLESWGIPVSFTEIDFREQLYQSLSFITKSLGAVLFFSGGMLLSLFFVLITLYFLLLHQNEIKTYITDLDLIPKKYFELISHRTAEIVNGTIRGYLLVVVLQLIVGVSCFLVFTIPAALLLGSLYALASLIPMVGGALVWVPVVLWQLLSGSFGKGLAIIAWFLISSFLVENIIAPKIIGKNTKLHQLFIMFSVFGGIQYFGLLGMILGPVIIALAFVALSILKEETK